MEKINKPEMREYCENCEYLSQKEKYGEGIYPCRKCDNKRLTDFFNSSHKKWESFYNQEIKKKNKEILESRNKVKMLKGMAAELSGCYDMDTAILHKEIFELREEIKLLNTLWELFEKFKNMDWDCFYRVDFYGCYYYWNSGNNKSQEFTGKTLVEALNKMWDSYNIDYPCPLTLKN